MVSNPTYVLIEERKKVQTLHQETKFMSKPRSEAPDDTLTPSF